MNRAILLGIVMVLLALATTAGAAVFTVTPTSDNDCSDYDCDLQSALTAAGSNGQNDTINLAAGTYHFSSTLRYVPTSPGENYSVTIIGTDSSSRVIVSELNKQPLLAIDMRLLTDISQASVHIKSLIIGYGNNSAVTSSVCQSAGETALVSTAMPGLIGMQGQDLFIINNPGHYSNFSESIYTGSTSDSYSLGSLGVICGPNTFGMSVPSNTSLTGTGTSNTGLTGTSTANLSGISTGGLIGGSSSFVSLSGSDANLLRGLDLVSPINPELIFNCSAIRLNEVNIAAVAGSTVTLDAVKNLNRISTASQGWTQNNSAAVTLSDPSSPTVTFVVPSPASGSNVLRFEHTSLNNDGHKIISAFKVNVIDNCITSFPNASVTFKSATNENMGMRVVNGNVTSLLPVDPLTLTNNSNKPANVMYGLMNMQIKVANPGDTAAVTVFLPAPAPAGYKWFKYSQQRGWYDFSDYATFNADRTQVTLTLVDGGPGDDDGVANGVIVDPSGLASNTPASASGGGCFIATAAYGSILHPHVATLRAFRDTFLLTNPVGAAFVKMYYKYSPQAADFIVRHDALRVIVRVCLLPAIALSWISLETGSNAISAIIVLLMSLLCFRLVYKSYKSAVRRIRRDASRLLASLSKYNGEQLRNGSPM